MAIPYDAKKRPLAVAVLAAIALTASPRPARAENVTPTAKGIAGGALLGGELVTFGEALFGVRSTAAYVIGAAAGAAAGGVGGYFVEQSVSDGRVPAYMLGGGLVLVIPAIVVALDQTRYLPTEGAREEAPLVGPPSGPGVPGGSSVRGAEPGTPDATTPGPGSATTPSTGEPSPAPTPAPAEEPETPAPQGSLLDVHGGAWNMGVPLPEVRPLLGARERTRMGVDPRGSELRFPVVRVTF